MPLEKKGTPNYVILYWGAPYSINCCYGVDYMADCQNGHRPKAHPCLLPHCGDSPPWHRGKAHTGQPLVAVHTA
uniref:Uncharacterized protein n=1 Tax=Rhabditophanes sp. KR3021 TaxID=114890 RepID=A0AC35UBX6_9BILA